MDDRDLQGARARVPQLNQFKNAIEVYELILEKWPMDPTAPDVQNAIAEMYDQLERRPKRAGTPEHDATTQRKALEARTALANYIGNTPWVDANKDNPAAIQNAEQLVRRRASPGAPAHAHATTARRRSSRRDQTGDPRQQLRAHSRALQPSTSSRRSAGSGTSSRTRTRPTPTRAATGSPTRGTSRCASRSRLHKVDPKQYPEPTPQEIDDAKQAAIDVRDSNEDDKFLDNAGLFVVDLQRRRSRPRLPALRDRAAPQASSSARR